MSHIQVSYEKPYFLITFPYNKPDLSIVQHLPVREFDKKRKLWKVHQLLVKTLSELPGEWSQEALVVRRKVDSALLDLVDYKFAEASVSKKRGEDFLKPYQVVGASFLEYSKKSLLADEMGLGKTAQAIQATLWSGGQKVLILCPASLKGNWAHQFQKHFDIEALIISGDRKKRHDLWKSSERFKIANYDLLNTDWEAIQKEWDSIIVDEAVYLKNHRSIRTKLARRLHSEYRFALSGFPFENNLSEFYNLMMWIRPELLPNFMRFRERYFIQGFGGSVIGYKNLEELHLITSPFVLRRKKSDVLQDLSPKLYSDFELLDMSEKAKRIYRKLADDFVLWLDDQHQVSVKSALERTIRLRQFVEFPELIGIMDLNNPRLEWLHDIYNSIEKLVVFTFFEQSADLLRRHFKTEFFLSGDLPPKDRLPLVQRFNSHPGKAILISTDAGRFGLDMVGAGTMVHYGYFFNPATMIQREDRLHRMGQEHDSVHVLRPYYPGTIDVGIRRVYMDRQEEAESFMDGSDTMSRLRLSKADFKRMVYGE